MELAEKISKALGLLFINLNELGGNVCFVNNNDELRPEFKEIFTTKDLLNYAYALLYSENYRADLIDEVLPKDRVTFWKLVALGSILKASR